ncbi:hypothetical protein K435DRAFT_867963 [Dendrothele bispora CBS 962.96]|uniref:Uncharacterized protein n=1 Tax=Dendrothele bispora (strain CBS 962.96) TaxID=1314807 RepID=A0A4S8LCU7_DENBC|nr:hypothetical protein K435DRAFT_867963 [Dendrothele bispora CBS 962.96]
MSSKKGRPAKYHTEEQRRAAKRERNRNYHDRRGRELRLAKRAQLTERILGTNAGIVGVPPAPPSSPPSSFFGYSAENVFLDMSTPAGARFRKRFRDAIRRCRSRKAVRYGLPSRQAVSPTHLTGADLVEVPPFPSTTDSQPSSLRPSPNVRSSRPSRFVVVESDSEEGDRDPNVSKPGRESTPENDSVNLSYFLAMPTTTRVRHWAIDIVAGAKAFSLGPR